ncbi:head-tail adaptor protein [Sinorhizobium medicae]|uniref:head-tail adaptor protein n=1 Tax=Rhizobium meliloti TaxID=382 RepID=UPI00299D34CB|nr:head-tail adaptor protein [Sinorhizobium meliloti]MDX0432686.1 head-tail adaptor protein [Sinorhizobium medicae]MDW9513266.1 head-tail adaptor protein [Sinorhizobium meliloti]MDW9543303.1 head-tail adaptor protein [Sinorhizobium meliloti]MDX0992088.1 head-tail adaptor protein [Sinorhizobium medicae]
MPAGKLRSRLHFQQRTTGDDGYGGIIVGDFATVFTDAAEIIPRMGSEAVLGARLQGLQPVTIRVRSHVATRALGATWRAVDARSGAVYAITSPPVNVSQKNDYIDMLATIGTQADA